MGGLSVVDVLVDIPKTFRSLSYFAGDDPLHVGDEVVVPYGSREARGLVVGEGSLDKATRHVAQKLGNRFNGFDVTALADIAHQHMVDPLLLWRRVGPTNRPLTPTVLSPTPPKSVRLPQPDNVTNPTGGKLGRYLICPPNLELLTETVLWVVSRLATGAPVAGCQTRPGSVLVLCPTKTWVEALVGASGGVIANHTTPGVWEHFTNGTLPIVAGTRAAGWWSPPMLAGIVLVDDSHVGHREQRNPLTHSRQIAAARTKTNKATMVTVTSNVTAAGMLPGLKVVRVAPRSRWPHTKIVDRNNEPPETKTVPTVVQSLVATALTKGDRPVVVTPHHQTVLRCTHCYTPAVEPNKQCATCGQKNQKRFGITPETISKCFPAKTRVIDRAGLGRLRNPASLTVLLDIDPYLYRATLTPATDLAGLYNLAAQKTQPGGTLVFVTTQPEHNLLQHFIARDPLAAAKTIWEEAKTAGLPPFKQKTVLHFQRKTRPNLSELCGTVYGPKQTGPNSWEATILHDKTDILQTQPALGNLIKRGNVYLQID
ncbi:MAG: hypothetical protein WC184_11775 [Acidimicrobiia bacterium]